MFGIALVVWIMPAHGALLAVLIVPELSAQVMQKIPLQC